MFVTITLVGRTFDASGDCNGHEEVPAVVLDGVTLNGSPIFEDEFDRNGRLVRG